MKDLSHLPTHSSNPDRPFEVPPGVEWTSKFVDFWIAEYKRQGRDTLGHAVEGTRLRGSWSGKCARRISYHLLGYEETNPATVAGFWRMEQGTIVHDYWQAAAKKLLGEDCTVEAIATYGDEMGSVHTDLVVQSPKYGKVAFELKTIGGYGFKVALGLFGDEPGPKNDHFLQGAVNAKAHDADMLVIVYISQENVNPSWAADAELHPAMEFAVEWSYPREFWEPYADIEIRRQQHIVGLAENEELAPRSIPHEMPKGSRLEPVKSTWTLHDDDGAVVDMGKIWGGKYCNYCPFQQQCIDDMSE